MQPPLWLHPGEQASSPEPGVAKTTASFLCKRWLSRLPGGWGQLCAPVCVHMCVMWYAVDFSRTVSKQMAVMWLGKMGEPSQGQKWSRLAATLLQCCCRCTCSLAPPVWMLCRWMIISTWALLVSSKVHWKSNPKVALSFPCHPLLYNKSTHVSYEKKNNLKKDHKRSSHQFWIINIDLHKAYLENFNIFLIFSRQLKEGEF